MVGLQDFHFLVEHLPGTANVSADCLSHLVASDEEDKTVEDILEEEFKVCEVTFGVITEEEWSEV